MAGVTGKTITELRVIDLKHQLEKRGLDRNGVKQVLLQRLKEALDEEGHDPDTFVFGKKQKSQIVQPETDAEQPEAEALQENGNAKLEGDDVNLVVEDEEPDEEEQDEGEENFMEVEQENLDDHEIQDMEVCNDKEDGDNTGEKNQKETGEKDKLDTPRKGIVDKPHVIWVLNLNSNSNAIELKATFSDYGHVVSAKILTAKSLYYEAGTLFGHLEMASKEEAVNAISAMNNTEYKGKIVRVLNNQDFLKEKEALRHKRLDVTKRPFGFKPYDRSREDGRRPFEGRRSPFGGHHYKKPPGTFHFIKKEREHYRDVDRDRREREEERRRQIDDAEMSRRYKEESMRLKREHDKLRREKEKLRREREELERLERQRERFEREKLHKERVELERSVYKLEEDRRRTTYSDERYDDRRHGHHEDQSRYEVTTGHSRRSSNEFRGTPSFQNSYRSSNERGRHEKRIKPTNKYPAFDGDRWADVGHDEPVSGPVYHQPRMNDRFHYIAPMNRY